ncbi:unnamed protein product [Ectocarpus sp. CCAP 1310/34]|nr:unnamed protein product [Ectocarpus sp. CCAP 1310/34]
MSNLGNDTAHPVQHGGVQGQQTALVLGAHPSMNVPAYPKTATPGGFYHPQHHAQPYATANGTVWGSGRDPRTAGAMAPPAGLPGICGVSGVVSAAASAAQAAWLGSQSGRASEALPTAKRTHDGQLVQHARSHAGWAQAQGCPRDGAPPPHSAPSPGPLTGAAASSTPVATSNDSGVPHHAPPPHSAPSPGPLTGAAASSTPVATSNDSGVPHQPASSPRGAAAAGAPPTDLTGSLVDPPRSAFLPGPPSSAAIAGPATTDLAGLGEPLAGSGDAKGVEGAAGGAVQLLAVASNTAVAAAAGKENVHTPPKKGGQNYNGLYLSLLLEALLDACKTRDDGKWRMKTTCSTNWGEQKAIADAVFEKWQKASLDERMRYGGRSDSTLEYGKGAQANFLTSKKHQYRKWANQPAEARQSEAFNAYTSWEIPGERKSFDVPPFIG